MKILFATYPMAFHTPGGGELQLLSYKKSLEKKGYEISLFDPWKPNFSDFDIFHFFSCIGGSEPLCSFVKKLKIPLVISSSLWITEENKINYDIPQIKNQLSNADVIITNSTIESIQLSNMLDINIENFHTVYNGVSDIFLNARPNISFKHNFNINHKFILNVGNIEQRKNQLNLAKIIHRFPGYKLILIGHIREPEYAKEVFNIGGDNLIYFPHIPHGDLLMSAYQECEVFCLPSTLETPGLSAIEAATLGAKILLTSIGSTSEYFGKFATYIDPSSVDSLFNGLRHVLADNKDTSFLSTKMKNNFLWDSVIEELIKAYMKVI